MGYCYSAGGGLICEGCGTDVGVRKRRCPHGWCQADALCSECNATKRPPHKGCKEAAERWKADQRRHQELLDEGCYVRCSALGVGSGSSYRVHVLFENKSGETQGFYMAKETYNKLPLAVPVTADDYRQYGELEPAPSTFDFGGTSKQVA